MKTSWVAASLLSTAFFCAAGAAAQDAAAMAAEQAMQQAQMANQQAIQQAQMAMQQAQLDSQQAQMDSQQAAQNAQSSTPKLGFTRSPSFSVKAGTIAAGTTVRLKSATHYAVIYYTTDGWTPTVHSRKYTGPITIRHSIELQAMAIAPDMQASLPARAVFTVPGAPAEPAPLALNTDGLLPAGTRLHLATDGAVASSQAQVGDALKLILNQDIVVDGKVVAPKGTPVEARITTADRAAHLGEPGDLAFEVTALQLPGMRVPLTGGETLEGQNHFRSVVGWAAVPGVGALGLLRHGGQAEIKPGMRLTAAVAQDTRLLP